MNEYIKRYFDGTLSEAEELRLKDSLLAGGTGS